MQAYRADGKHKIGIVVNLEPKYPASDSAEDLAAVAARRCLHEPAVPRSGVLRQAIPTNCKEIFGDAWPEWPADDFALIKQPIDFLGVNYYTRSVTRNDPATIR